MEKKNRSIVYIIAAIAAVALITIGICLNIRLITGTSDEVPAESTVSVESMEPVAPESETTIQSGPQPDVQAESSVLPAEAESSAYGEMLKGVSRAAVGNVSDYADSYRARQAEGVTGETQPTSANGKIVCIDAGHQDHGMSDTEPNGPGSSTMKAKLTTGTTGNTTGVDEYVVNLQVSLALRDELQRRGYTVVMTRETNEVNISNVERAQIANNANADIFIRIHCNSSDDSSVHGALTYQPSSSNPYLSSEVIAGSQRLAQVLLDSQLQVTGQRNAGIIYGDDMTGINWAQMPVTIVEMGFMSNPSEDQYLVSSEGQAQIVQGLANGVDAYFAS